VETPHASIKPFYRRLFSLLLSIFLAYLLVLAVVRTFESRMIFFPNYPGRLDGNWHPRDLNVEDVWLTAADGVKLHAWWIPDVNARFTVLAFHGNASNIANRAPTYEFLHESHVNILALEYRGYGRSEGQPSEAGIYRDAEAAYEYVVNAKGIDHRTVVSFGQSLGTAVATHLATRRQVGGVVLEAPFPSASRVARKVFWFLPGLHLLTYGQFDTRTWLKEIHAPVLVIHCSQDLVIPFEFGREVFEQALPPKNFLQVNGYCHEESSIIAPIQYHKALQEFLNGL
jgi:uncharacterized protein